MSEGKYTRDGYIPWTPELIIEEADAEAGPGCCDESYQKLCTVMIAGPELLSALKLCNKQLCKLLDKMPDMNDEQYKAVEAAGIAIARAER